MGSRASAFSGFLFHTGSIKRFDPKSDLVEQERRFYSILVRLKVVLDCVPITLKSRFLFHTGSIKRNSHAQGCERLSGFLFHTGSIKSPHNV